MFDITNLFNIFGYKPSKNEIAKLLKSSPEALEKFEKAYKKNYLDKVSDNLFEVSAAQASAIQKENQNNSNYTLPKDLKKLKEIKEKIIQELIEQTSVYSFTKKENKKITQLIPQNTKQKVTQKDINKLPASLRPQLTGYLMKRDIPTMSYPVILENYAKFLHETSPKKKKHFYDTFRQGLDLLDLDPIIYNIIGNNPNSIGNWFPRLVESANENGNLGCFCLPDTSIIKVPITLLQLTRSNYMTLSSSTIQILNEYCKKIFELDNQKNYFVKTGTYSSKFDFRNAKVTGEKEVDELGQYLMYIHFQALSMAHYDLSGCKQPVIYGVSTTNEWCVREFIEDEENAPVIYNGLPLHCEYRLFVDFDHKQVLSIHPYWDEKVMQKRFNESKDSNEPKNLHDAITFGVHKDTLKKQYNETKDFVVRKMQDVLQKNNIGLKGQWSVDIMKNGNTYWLIDMALAQNSAYYDSIPENLKNPIAPEQEPWISAINIQNIIQK